MSNIRELKTRKQEHNEQTVAMLTEWLEMAKTGELQTVAAAGILAGGESITGATASDAFQPLLGAVTILQFRMLHGHCEGSN